MPTQRDLSTTATPKPATWKRRDAKAQFSELVRRTYCERPQRVTTHGKNAVVIISEEEYQRLQDPVESGRRLVEAMQLCPGDDLVIERYSYVAPIQDIER